MQKRLRVGIAGVVFLIVALLGYWGASITLSERQNGASSQLQAAPDFTLKDAQGREVRLESLKGKPVVLHFWASWCPPCLEEIHEWVEAAKRYEGKPIHWVAVSLDHGWEDAHKILPESELTKGVLSLLDTESKVSDAYGSYQFPETYFLDADLKIKGKWVGPQDWAGPAAQKAIETLMNGK